MSTENGSVRDAEAVFEVEGPIRPTATARGDGIPRCLRTQACSYALHRDLGDLHAVPTS